MHQYRFWLKSLTQRGFTLLENLIIFVVIGVFIAIAVPSLNQMLENANLKKSIVEVQVAFSSAQRQAIRDRDGCEVGILENRDPNDDENVMAPSFVYGECLPVLDSPLSENTIVATNLEPLPDATTASNGTLVNPNSSSDLIQGAYEWCVEHESHNHAHWEAICRGFRQEAPLKFAQMLYRANGAVTFTVKSAFDFPADPSAKLVFYNEGKSRRRPKCMVISRSLGLTRTGQYSGSVESSEMTDSGSCHIDSWDQQA